MAKVDRKYLVLKPEVEKIFEDLEKYKDFCRFNGQIFDERDLYRSETWRRSVGQGREYPRRNFRTQSRHNG